MLSSIWAPLYTHMQWKLLRGCNTKRTGVTCRWCQKATASCTVPQESEMPMSCHDASDSREVSKRACCCGKQYSWTCNYKLQYSKLVSRLTIERLQTFVTEKKDLAKDRNFKMKLSHCQMFTVMFSDMFSEMCCDCVRLQCALRQD